MKEWKASEKEAQKMTRDGAISVNMVTGEAIVLDSVQIKMVLVIVVGLLIGVQILPQFILHRAVGGLCRQQVRILREISPLT